MAKRRKPRNYKICNAFTKDMGSGGGQIHLGYVSKVDAQGITAWINNLQCSAIVNNYDGGDETPGIMFYLTTNNSWSDDYVITAAATAVGGKVSLSAKRTIVENTNDIQGNEGKVNLWAELTDITVSDNIDLRVVVETWGRFVLFTEV